MIHIALSNLLADTAKNEEPMKMAEEAGEELIHVNIIVGDFPSGKFPRNDMSIERNSPRA